MTTVKGTGTNPNEAGVYGESTGGEGVLGTTTSEGHSGVAGVSDQTVGNGVYGRSEKGNGVIGFSSATGFAGVAGANDRGNGPGVYGRSKLATGVHGESTSGEGVHGHSKSAHGGVVGTNDNQSDNAGAGVWGESTKGEGVRGVSHSAAHAGVVGVNDVGTGIWGQGAQLAAHFEGDVEVTGDIRLTNADCAEDFDISGAETVEPGTVMVLGDTGALLPSGRAYDKRVAGVISGAGDYKPGIVLDKQAGQGNRSPVALLGKVFCKVDARYGAVEVGDLLTTSDTPGCAMKAADPAQAFGAVIGKALRPLREGQGLVPVLVALQ